MCLEKVVIDNVTVLQSIVGFYFLPSPFHFFLIALVLFVFRPRGALVYERIQPLSCSVLQGPVPLQTNEETQGCARTITPTVKNSRTALFVDLQQTEFFVYCIRCVHLKFLVYYQLHGYCLSYSSCS